MRPTRLKSVLLLLLAALLLWHTLLFYGLPLPALFLLWLLLCAWLFHAGPPTALLAACMIAIFSLLLNIFINITGIERSIYYRPHELMKSSRADFGETFRSNTEFRMEAQFGDIEAREKAGIREPHEIAYRTDSLGFRNPADYRQQDFVLVGDSFLAGANDSESCLISEWLRKDHRLDTYNLGFPGDMNDYVRRINAFRQINGNDFKLALFVFEGNDFRPFSNLAQTDDDPLSSYHNYFKQSSLWRYTRWLYLRGSGKNKDRGRQALVHPIGELPMAFLSSEEPLANNRTPYTEASLRFTNALQLLKPNLVQIFFVPTKYRVYARWIASGGGHSLPNTQWEYLERAARQANVPVFDLTPALIQEAERLLPAGQYVYWRDDTHWNCHGMRAAAGPVAQQLRSR